MLADILRKLYELKKIYRNYYSRKCITFMIKYKKENDTKCQLN